MKANVLFIDKKPASKTACTTDLWIYDLRTNKQFTLKQKKIRDRDMKDFLTCYQAADRRKRKESKRFKRYTYDELLKRDKVSLDIFWLKDDSFEDSADLPKPDVIGAQIVSDLETALAEFKGALGKLKSG